MTLTSGQISQMFAQAANTLWQSYRKNSLSWVLVNPTIAKAMKIKRSKQHSKYRLKNRSSSVASIHCDGEKSSLREFRSYRSYINNFHCNSRYKRITKRQWKNYVFQIGLCETCYLDLRKAKRIIYDRNAGCKYCCVECFIGRDNFYDDF